MTLLRTVVVTYLLNISFNSCSETNWPRLATNNVEHGAALMLTVGCDCGVDPTGDPNAGDGKKCGNDAACIAVNAAVGCCIDKGGCKQNHYVTFSFSRVITLNAKNLCFYYSSPDYCKFVGRIRNGVSFVKNRTVAPPSSKFRLPESFFLIFSSHAT